MIPFLRDDKINLVFSLLQIVVKPDKLQECETMSDVKKNDLGKKENLLKACNFNTGFVSIQFIKELRRKDKVSSHEVLSYKRNVYEFWYQLLKECLIKFQSNQQSFVML